MKSPTSKGGFSLVELAFAIGIATFCLLAILALLPAGLNSNRDTINTTYAASLAETLVTDLRGVESGGTSLRYGIDPASQVADTILYLSQDGAVEADATRADYRLSYSITPPTSGISPTLVRIVVSWPAAATDPSNVYEVVTAIDRN